MHYELVEISLIIVNIILCSAITIC